jgi:hypothetical protein
MSSAPTSPARQECRVCGAPTTDGRCKCGLTFARERPAPVSTMVVRPALLPFTRWLP